MFKHIPRSVGITLREGKSPQAFCPRCLANLGLPVINYCPMCGQRLNFAPIKHIERNPSHERTE